jgi:hypothetical protein
VQERAQGHRGHRFVVLEYGVQSDHRDVVGFEHRVNALRLRQTVLHAARAQHLEGVQRDDPSAQRRQRQRRSTV